MRGWKGWMLLVAGAGGLGVLVGGAAGVIVSLLALAGGAVALRRMEPAVARRERERAVADLPITADLLAAALRAGAPPDHAAMVVGEALGGPVGIRLVRVARALRLGATPEVAWRHLAEVPGGDRLAGAATRSAERGSALTRALDHQATDLRAARVTAGEAAARRVGVLVVLPLGLCFLPAFLLAGVVPVVVAVLGDVLGQSP
jgi:pilus assembly protein TadC